jgi:hypothetical protein
MAINVKVAFHVISTTLITSLKSTRLNKSPKAAPIQEIHPIEIPLGWMMIKVNVIKNNGTAKTIKYSPINFNLFSILIYNIIIK